MLKLSTLSIVAACIFTVLCLIPRASASVWCYQCVSTQPGCGTPFDWRWYSTKSCDKCVKIIERKGADEIITRNCLRDVEYSRHDVPADKYEGCRSAAVDVRLAHYVNNTVKELDVKRTYYDSVTWCFCEFDHWCNSGFRSLPSMISIGLVAFAAIIFQ